MAVPTPSLSADRSGALRSGLDALALQEENERLRRENAKLMRVRTQVDLEELKAIREENDKLWRRNVELEKSSVGAAEGGGDQRSNDQSTLEPRGYGTQFDIHLWEVERRSQKGGASQDASQEGAIALVPTDPSASQMQPRSEDVQAEPAMPRAVGAQLDSAVQPWIFHHTLASARSQSLGSTSRAPPCLEHIQRDIVNGNQDEVTRKLTDDFRKHLEDLERPHLAFSALMPSLFGMLCRADQLTSATGISGCRYAQCVSIIRHLIQTCPFGEKPPKRRPETMARDTFVRELCAQVGLSLDLARLAFAHRQELGSWNSSSQLEEEPAPEATSLEHLPLQDSPPEAGEDMQKAKAKAKANAKTKAKGKRKAAEAGLEVLESQPSKRSAAHGASTSSARTGVCVEKPEVKAALARAGRYMAAVQMDMERLHDEHVSRQRKSGSELGGSEQGDEETEGARDAVADQAAAAPLAITNGMDTSAAALNEDEEKDEEVLQETPGVRKKTEVRSLVAAASSDPVVDESSAPSSATQAMPLDTATVLSDPDDALAMPPFGKFLGDQLLPLYVGDVPFETLKHLADQYCGFPLDSDDEERAWKVLGRKVPNRKTRKSRAENKKRKSDTPPSREISAGDTSRVETTPAPGVSPESSESLDLSQSSEPRSRTLMRRASSGEVPIAELRQAIEKKPSMDPPKMRAQMLTSVVEKRRTDHRAPADMSGSIRAAAMRQRSYSSSTLATLAATPGINPSLALLSSPQEHELGPSASERKAAWRAAVGTTVRRGKHDRLHLRDSPAPAPNWNFLDSPAPSPAASPAPSPPLGPVPSPLLGPAAAPITPLSVL